MMPESAKEVILESDWLPPAELERLVSGVLEQFPDVSSKTSGEVRRGIDPAIAVAIVTGVVNLIVPFVTQLAQRLFRAEPNSRIDVQGKQPSISVTILAGTTIAECERLLKSVMATGAVISVRISIDG
jgi:hypothetical protein